MIQYAAVEQEIGQQPGKVEAMNKVYEAVKKDGTHELIAPSLFKGYVKEAKIAANGNSRKVDRLLGQMIANLMYVRNYVSLVGIEYDGEGNQKRTWVMRAA